jgi:hypothetical protein
MLVLRIYKMAAKVKVLISSNKKSRPKLKKRAAYFSKSNQLII